MKCADCGSTQIELRQEVFDGELWHTIGRCENGHSVTASTETRWTAPEAKTATEPEKVETPRSARKKRSS